MSEVERKQSGGESMDDCWSKGLNGFNKGHVHCPVVKNVCLKESCMFYGAEVDYEPAEYDANGHVILMSEFGSEEYWNEYQKSVMHHCLVLEILEGLHWLVGRWDDNCENENGLKSLVANMANGNLNVNTYEQNTTRYIVTE